MKKSVFVTGLLVALVVIFAALGALCGAVAGIATDASFYVDDSRLAVAAYLGRALEGGALSEADEAAVTLYVGLTREEQTDFAAEIARQMRDAEATFELELLQAHEQQHMRDVRDLIALADRVARGCAFVAALLAVAAAWTGMGLARRRRTIALGALCGAGLLVLVAGAFLLAMNAAGFERLFVEMHKLLFTNRYWLLNPSTDILIRMMPQPLFEAALGRALAGAGVRFAAVMAMLAALHAVVGGIIHRNWTERERA